MYITDLQKKGRRRKILATSSIATLLIHDHKTSWLKSRRVMLAMSLWCHWESNPPLIISKTWYWHVSGSDLAHTIRKRIGRSFHHRHKQSITCTHNLDRNMAGQLKIYDTRYRVIDKSWLILISISLSKWKLIARKQFEINIQSISRSLSIVRKVSAAYCHLHAMNIIVKILILVWMRRCIMKDFFSFV